MPFASTGREALNANERLWQWKFGLRFIVLIFAVISIGLLGSILGKIHFDSYYSSFSVLAATNLWCCVALGCCMVWAIICNLYLVIRKKPVHPGWAVGADLIAWLVLVIPAGAAITEGAFGVQDRSSIYYDGYSPCSSSYSYSSGGYYTTNCDDDSQTFSDRMQAANIQLAGGVFAMIVALLEFTLFVWACVDTNRHNRCKGAARVSMMTDRAIADMRQRGQLPAEYPPMQPQQQQQPLLYSAGPTGVANGRDVEQGGTGFNNNAPPQVPPPPTISQPVEITSPGWHPVYRSP